MVTNQISNHQRFFFYAFTEYIWFVKVVDFTDRHFLKILAFEIVSIIGNFGCPTHLKLFEYHRWPEVHFLTWIIYNHQGWRWLLLLLGPVCSLFFFPRMHTWTNMYTLNFKFTRKHIDDFTIIYFSSCNFLAKLQNNQSLATSTVYKIIFLSLPQSYFVLKF